jgi:hypothetical protein
MQVVPMIGEAESQNGSEWKRFLARHWKIFVLFVAACILAFIGVILVYLWFVGNAQSTGLVPSVIGQWTMGQLVSFILNLIFWEILFIGIPVIIAAIVGWQWWKRLPSEERKEYRFFGKRSRASRGGGGVSGLLFIAFAIKVYADGNWNVAMSTWTVDYVVYSFITILVWVAVILGIPAVIVLIWWISRGRRRSA